MVTGLRDKCQAKMVLTGKRCLKQACRGPAWAWTQRGIEYPVLLAFTALFFAFNGGDAGFSSSRCSSWAEPPASVPSKSGNNVDTLEIRLMMQNQYSKVGSAESLWDSHTATSR